MLGPALRVSDQAQQRPFGGHLDQQPQDPKLDQEPVGLGVGEPEDSPQRAGLGGGQPGQSVQDRPEQQVQGRERELDLGLDPGTTQSLEVAGLSGSILEQAVLSDAGLATNHQHAAVAPPGIFEHANDERAFLAPSIQHETSRSGQGPPSKMQRLGDLLQHGRPTGIPSPRVPIASGA